MREVEGLRKELAPHLRFLQSQVKKVEESQKLRDELSQRYLEYLKRESVYLAHEEARLRHEKKEPEHEQHSLEARVARLREQLEKKHDNGSDALVHLEEEGRQLLRERDSLGRKLGRIEGELAAAKRVVTTEIEQVAVREVETFLAEVQERIQSVLQSPLEAIKEQCSLLIGYVNDFVVRIKKTETATDGVSEKELLKEKESLERELLAVEKKEEKIAQELSQLRARLESQKDASRDAERELFSAMARRSELESTLAKLRGELQQIEHAKEEFKQELGEAAAFIGRAVLEYEAHVVHDAHGVPQTEALVLEEPRHAQEDRRKKIERIKIRLEEAGLGGASEILKEFEETSSRDAFLARELEDLGASRTSLLTLIDELAQTLQAKFANGIEKINTEFNTFFVTMFGGGSAGLSLTAPSQSRGGEDAEDEDTQEQEEGIEIAISLPHKRIKGLHMLSGGERALTSIALIFAMSQVHPPPFLILDETDAALDEANSRRYGDMIATLAKKSQLILITHNRETMSRAGVLYGVTMGSDGVSKLLSVRFEDALAVAK
jgi:chromosome segregation protein